MTRYEAIDILKNTIVRFGRTNGKTVYAEALQMAIKALEEPQWIPCSERLPEKYIGQWLCCTSDGDVMILPYDTPGDGTKECVFYKLDDYGYSYQIFDVIAWMPLPAPYQGEGDSNDR